MKATLIITILNESESILQFLKSIAKQSRLPDEIIITDGGSTDSTVMIIQSFIRQNLDLNITLLQKGGNRSVGRNNSIYHAKHEIIAVTDAGCHLSNIWFEKIVQPFNKDTSIDVVAGWYQPKIHTPWQKSLAMVLDFNVAHVNINTFLPSTRSMAFTKSAWRLVGGFDERLSHNEDTPFSLELKKKKVKFAFAPDAIVYWELPSNYRNLFSVISRYALGDAQSKLFRSQYWIALAFWCSLIISLVLLYCLPWIGIILMFVIICYLYLPLYYNIKHISFYNLLTIPMIKLTMLAANFLGFIKGLTTNRINNHITDNQNI